MKIGVDARPLLPPITGIGRYLEGFLDALQAMDRENEYALFCHRPMDYPCRNRRWRIVHGHARGRLRSTGWFQMAVPRLASRMGLDLFWGTRHHLPLGLSRRTATVLTVHDLVHRRYPGTMALPNLLLERLLMGPSLRRADRVATVSLATEREIGRLYPEVRGKIRTIPPGIPGFPPEMPFSSRPPGPYFLFVGTLEPRKNLERVIRAFRGLKTGGEPVHLAIVGGGGWKRRSLDGLLRDSDVEDSRIHPLGYVPRAALPGLYRNAVGLVFPSLYEGFGFPILEAMSLGIPVVTSDRSSMSEVARGTALRVNPFRVEAIRSAMERLLDGSERERLVRRGRDRIGDFSWERSAADLLTLFRDVANRKANRR